MILTTVRINIFLLLQTNKSHSMNCQSQCNIINEIYQISNGNIDLLHYNDCIFYMFYQQGPVLFKNVTFDVQQQILLKSYSGLCINGRVSEIHCV